MSTPLRSLLLGFGIEVQGKEKLDEVDSKLDSLIEKAKKLGEGLAAAFLIKEVAGFITDQIDVGRNLSLTAEKLGITVDELERYRFAANQAGVDTAQADLALMRFNRQLGESELSGKTAAKGIGKVGDGFTAAQLSAMPLGEMMGHIAVKMGEMTDKGQKTQIMMRLFGRQGTALIPMFDELAKDPKKYDAMFDALGGGIGADFANKAREVGNSIKRLSFTFDVLKTRMAGAVLPWVEKLVLMFITLVVKLEWLEKHSYMAKTALIALAVAGAAAFAPFLLSVLPIVAAFTALYLVFDDLFTMFAGGHSVTGKLLDQLFGKGSKKTFITEVKKDFSDFIDWVETRAIPMVKSFGTWLSSAWTTSLPYMRAVGSALLTLGKLIEDFVTGHWSKMGKDIDDMGSGKVDMGQYGENWKKMQEELAKKKWLDDLHHTVDTAIANPSIPLPAGGATSSSVPVPSSVQPPEPNFTIGNVNVTVTPAAGSDPTQVGAQVGHGAAQVLKRHFKKAKASYPPSPHNTSADGSQGG